MINWIFNWSIASLLQPRQSADVPLQSLLTHKWKTVISYAFTDLSIISDGIMIFICKKYTVAGHLGLVIVIYACASRSYKKGGEKKARNDFLL